MFLDKLKQIGNEMKMDAKAFMNSTGAKLMLGVMPAAGAGAMLGMTSATTGVVAAGGAGVIAASGAALGVGMAGTVVLSGIAMSALKAVAKVAKDTHLVKSITQPRLEGLRLLMELYTQADEGVKELILAEVEKTTSVSKVAMFKETAALLDMEMVKYGRPTAFNRMADRINSAKTITSNAEAADELRIGGLTTQAIKEITEKATVKVEVNKINKAGAPK